ncbi:amino acid permease [Seiridium cupressi]
MADPPTPPVTSALPPGDRPEHLSEMSEDEAALAALGYKQEFKREFSAWTTFAVSFAVMGLLPSIATTMWYGIGYAGPAANTWGWLLSVVFILCVASSMAELASSMPTSGGLYYASAVMAGPRFGPFAAWITGWSNWFVQVTGAPSVDYGCDYVPNEWQTFLLTVFIMITHACISSMPTLWIANFNSVGTVINILCLVITIIIIPAAATSVPKFESNEFAWGIQNFTDWPDGVAVLMSFLAIIWTMSGYDVDEIINSDLGQPWAAYLVQVLPQSVAIAVLAMTIICAYSMGQGCMVAASRVCFAYARDDCFGALSRPLKKVNRHTQTPVNAVWFNTSIGIVLNLLIFGGVAIGAIFSIGAIAAYVAFAVPILIKTVFVGNKFRRGPWHLGWFSLPSGILSVSFVLVMMPILCFPTVRDADLTPDLMNWTSLVYGAPMLFVIIWFVVDARKWFKGPKINIEHHMLHQDLSAHPGVVGIDPEDVVPVGKDADVEKGSSDKKMVV